MSKHYLNIFIQGGVHKSLTRIEPKFNIKLTNTYYVLALHYYIYLNRGLQADNTSRCALAMLSSQTKDMSKKSSSSRIFETSVVRLE